jgi:uncharacterized protein (TIGR02452 family)
VAVSQLNSGPVVRIRAQRGPIVGIVQRSEIPPGFSSCSCCLHDAKPLVECRKAAVCDCEVLAPLSPRLHLPQMISSLPSRYHPTELSHVDTVQNQSIYSLKQKFNLIMGRTTKSQGLAPPAIRKDARAKQARHIVNKVIPALLASNARARRGSESSELITDPARCTTRTATEQRNLAESADGGDETRYVKRKGQGRRKVKAGYYDDGEEVIVRAGHEKNKNTKGKKRTDLDESLSELSIRPSPPSQAAIKRTIRIITTDTLTATQLFPSPAKSSKKDPNPCILNMASPLRPGGGVLTGATSQEEYLCARTTLLPSLQESFYRLPEYGGIYTQDVLVFRNALPLAESAGELNPTERYYVDAISAGMLRFPELEGEEDEVKVLSKKDRAIVERKMRAVLRMVTSHGVKKLVLGAWGCGAYGNPVRDIAEAWSRVINGENVGGKKGKMTEPLETWDTITDIIFAISNTKMASDFAHAFSPTVTVEVGPGGQAEDEDDDETDDVAEELRTKIKELESQIGSVWNPELKLRMGTILDGLRTQLREREGDHSEADDDEGGDEHIEDSKETANESNEEEETSDEEDGEDIELDSENSEDGSEIGGLELPPVQ